MSMLFIVCSCVLCIWKWSETIFEKAFNLHTFVELWVFEYEYEIATLKSIATQGAHFKTII